MPIVLPPTVLGFYLLILLGPDGAIGSWWVQVTGSALTFSFTGLVIASCIYSLPFAVQPMQNAFESLPEAIPGAGVDVGCIAGRRILLGCRAAVGSWFRQRHRA